MRRDDTTGVPGQARASHRATGAGIAGSAFALLCCAGFAPLLGVLSAVGLGFLIKDAVLIPLLAVVLGVTLWGLWQGRRCHGGNRPLWIGAIGSLIVVAGVFAWVPLAFVGFVAVVAASVWNLVAARACLAPSVSP